MLNKDILINLLRDLPITMLVSTLDIRLVQELFPRTIVMDEGQVVVAGAAVHINYPELDIGPVVV